MSFDESINDLPTNVVSFRDGSSMTLGPGTEFDDFRVLEKLGRGGLGEVWKARDLTGNRDVALKFVPRDIQFHEEEMERVRETFQTIHALHHQHICPTLALRRHPDFGSYLMMAFVDGVPLSFYLRQVKKVPLNRALEILRPVAEALDYAHSRNVIHRDIKPGNVMLVFGKNPDGSMNFDQLRDVQLIDFGLASEFRQSMTRVSQVRMSTSGTRPYMSPEQFQGKGQDARTDQYSLGTLAYELLCGKLPFQAEDDFVLFNCIMNVQPEPLKDQPDWVNTALLQAMAKDRTVRFSSCVEFLTALEGKEAEKVKTARLEEEKLQQERRALEEERKRLEAMRQEEKNHPQDPRVPNQWDSRKNTQWDEIEKKRQQNEKPASFPKSHEKWDKKSNDFPKRRKRLLGPLFRAILSFGGIGFLLAKLFGKETGRGIERLLENGLGDKVDDVFDHDLFDKFK